MARQINRVRGHHLLCLLTFRGMGYSPTFIKNFKRVIKGFVLRPDSLAILATETDVICFACPYNKEGRCFKKEDSEKKAKTHDKRVLKAFGLKEGQRIKIREVLNEIKNKITPRDLSKICKKCSWLEHCSNLTEFN